MFTIWTSVYFNRNWGSCVSWMLLQGSQERALNEWPPSCYYVFMFSFLKTERKIERRRRRGALRRTGGGSTSTAAVAHLHYATYWLLGHTYYATSKYCTAAAAAAVAAFVRRIARARQEGTDSSVGLANSSLVSVFCTLVCLLLVSKRKLPALHLFVGTDALIQFRQGLGLHFFLARNQRGRELAL